MSVCLYKRDGQVGWAFLRSMVSNLGEDNSIECAYNVLPVNSIVILKTASQAMRRLWNRHSVWRCDLGRPIASLILQGVPGRRGSGHA